MPDPSVPLGYPASRRWHDLEIVERIRRISAGRIRVNPRFRVIRGLLGISRGYAPCLVPPDEVHRQAEVVQAMLLHERKFHGDANLGRFAELVANTGGHRQAVGAAGARGTEVDQVEALEVIAANLAGADV